MVNSEDEAILIDRENDNIEYEPDDDSHSDDFKNELSKDICSLERPPIMVFWGGMVGTIITGILFGPVAGTICLGIGLTSLGIDACNQHENGCGLPCIPNKDD